MTPIEQQALALINEVRDEDRSDDLSLCRAKELFDTTFPILCRTLERHEAYKREVSDALVWYFGSKEGCTSEALRDFILPDPVDPLVEAAQEVAIETAKSLGAKLEAYTVEQEWADKIRKALAARGLEIVEKKP